MAKDKELDEELEVLEEETEVEETEEKTPKKQNHGAFAEAIKAYLDQYAQSDSIFASRYNNPEKNISQCCDYIINQVKASGRQGFADEEIFAMARGYYTDDVGDVKSQKCTVVVNHTIELTEEEKARAKEKALKEYEASELKKLQDAKKKEEQARVKAEEKKKADEEKAKAKAEEEAKTRGYQQMDLFDIIGGE